MEVIITKNYDEMSTTAAKLVAARLEAKANALLSFPGGTTPIGMVHSFCEMVNNNIVDISKASFVSLDEWVGLSAKDEGSCGEFHEKNLFNKLEQSFADTHIINGAAANIEEEKETLNRYIKEKGPITVSVLGIGLNGHLGFNEAGVAPNLEAHIIPLDDVTKRVMSKYFGEKFYPTHGLTQGLKQIMEAETVILLADGKHKAEIIYKALKEPVNKEIPASILQNHPNCYVILDEGAASKL